MKIFYYLNFFKFFSNISFFLGFSFIAIPNIIFFKKFHNFYFFGFYKFNLIESIIININWLFGLFFLPLLPYWIYFFIQQNYKKFFAVHLIYVSFELIASWFEISGPVGLFFKLNFSNQALISLFLIINLVCFLLIKNQPKYKKRSTQIQIKPEVKIKQLTPSLDILSIGQKINIQINTELQKKNLVKIFKDFGIEIKIIDCKIGPVVTLHSAELASGIKASRVINLSNDIARAMEAFSVRIAQIPGKNLIGIEVSNEKRQFVYFKEGLITEKYKNFQGELPLYLGCNIYGEHEVFDLNKMPHLLVAGTTGSGKSVGIHTMLLSLLFKLNFNELKLILIDPKKLELAAYEDLPHLIFPVVTDSKQAINALKWAVKEMENRYETMAKVGVRNIASYNEKTPQEKMPFIVTVIDEMADLMLIAGKEIEVCVQRLAQMGRASGIHIIIATQRPSVDVITGTIKANLPTRISFKLATKIDSRTILGDASGADQLLGSGDMLFLSTDGKLTRIHGSYVSEEDVLNTVNFWKQQSEPKYINLSEESLNLNLESENTENEPYYKEAIALVKTTKKASTSFIQRHFQIGYNRAAKIMEQMEKDGIVSKGDKLGRHRDVL